MVDCYLESKCLMFFKSVIELGKLSVVFYEKVLIKMIVEELVID